MTETISAGIIRLVSKVNVKGHGQKSFPVTQDSDMIYSSSSIVYLWGGTDLKIKI